MRLEVGNFLPLRPRALRVFRLTRAMLHLVLFFLVVGSNAFPQAQAPQQEATTLRAAQAALEHGDAAEATRILSQHLQSHPDDLRARLSLAQAYAQANQPELAAAEFQTVLNTAPGNSSALMGLAGIYLEGGHLQDAEPLLARAVKAAQGNPQIRMQWAIVLARLHEYAKAQGALAGLLPPKGKPQQIAYHRLKASVALGLNQAGVAAWEMEKALALQPDDPGIMLATAAAQLQSGNFQRAAALTAPLFAHSSDPAVGILLLEAQLGGAQDFRGTLDALHSSVPGRTDELPLRLRIGELLVSHEKFSESLDDLQRAVALEPNRPELLFNLALAQFRAGHLEEAQTSAEKSRELADSADLEDLLGDIQEQRGDNLAAVKSYQAAVALAPSDEKYRLSLAIEFLKHKSFDASQLVLRQDQQLHPDSWRAEFTLGMVEYFEGNEDGACPILLRAAELSPDPSVALKYVGDIQIDRAAGPTPAILTRLCSFADRHPKDAQMQYYCGALLFRRDYASENKTNMPDILRRLKVASARMPNDPAPHCQLGRAYRWLEQWQPALHESEICAKLDPDSAQAHYRLAQLYHHEGQAARAKEEMALFESASKRVAEDIARRDQTMKTFLYTIQKQTPDQK